MELNNYIDEFVSKRRRVPTDREFLVEFPEMKQKTIDMYHQIFGVHIKINCTTCIMDYFFELKSLTNTQIDNLMNLNFKLRDGVLVEVDNIHFSSRSKKMTPEIGHKIFNKYGMRVFEYYNAFPDKEPEAKEPEAKEPKAKEPEASTESPPDTTEKKQELIKKAGRRKPGPKAKK